MIEEFQKLLQTPKPSSDSYLKMMQDAMLNTMQQLMPQNFDFGQLAKMFEKQTQQENLASLTYKLTEFFIRVISQNFISLQSYFGLQQQTQKLQSTIRGHIKMEQQMKMYLEHLEYKIERYEYHLKKLRKQNHQSLQSSHQLRQFKEKDSLQHLKKRQTQLLKERLILLRKVDHLQRKLKDQQVQLRRLNSPTSATIQQIKQGINRDRKISQAQVQSRVFNCNELISKPMNEIDRRMSTNSFGSDHQITQKKTSIPINTLHMHRQYSLTGKEAHQVGSNLTSIQQLETRKQIQIQGDRNCLVQKSQTIVEEYGDLNSPIEHLIRVQ